MLVLRYVVDWRMRMMSINRRINGLPWQAFEESLWLRGYAQTERPVLTATECALLKQMYSQQDRFRSRVEMERHRFGVGDYQYFADPLPALVQSLRDSLYPFLAP